jgi:ABC-type multidrug transport system fused ATPase/permease subunit
LAIKGGQKVAVLSNDRNITQGFFNLLLKNIPYDQGELLIDGIKLSDIEANLIKSKVSIISSVIKMN